MKRLFHIAIKTDDLVRSIGFYETIMGLGQVPRPDLDFPGAWLAAPGNEHEPLIHLYTGYAAEGPDGASPKGTMAIDHVSFWAHDFHALQARCEHARLPWRANVLSTVKLWQLFVHDPSGVMIELTFDATSEPGPAPLIPPERQYRPAEIFFDPASYIKLLESKRASIDT